MRKQQIYINDDTREYYRLTKTSKYNTAGVATTYTLDGDGYGNNDEKEIIVDKKDIKNLRLVDDVEYSFLLKSYPENYNISVIPLSNSTEVFESYNINYSFCADIADIYDTYEELVDGVLEDLTDLVSDEIGDSLTTDELHRLSSIADSIAFNYANRF